MSGLPDSWEWCRLNSFADVNPKFDKTLYTDDLEISFVPMKRVSAMTGKVDLSEKRLFSKVKKGYTPFINGDIIFAKITPCMENGKIAVLQNLMNGIGFGSTEFHVIRLPKYFPKIILFYFLLQNEFRKKAKRNMTGSVGQKRVPADFLNETIFPLSPLPEQYRIVAKIEELFSKLDAGVKELEQAKTQLKRYRQSVLKSAMDGKLTEEWRKEHKPEPADKLLEQIQEERKAKLGKKYKEPTPVDTTDLPELPEGWVWSRIGEISKKVHYGFTAKSSKDRVGPKMLRITDIQNSQVNWDEVPFCKIDDEYIGKYLLNKSDLVFARTGATVGKSYLIKENVPKAVFASYLIRIILSELVEKKYISYFFRSLQYWKQIVEGQLGIGQPNVNATKLSNLIIPIPSYDEQKKIVEEIDRIFSIMDETELVIESELKRSQSLRQSILKRAFEGKLVPQNPMDEPASKLLQRIQLERTR